MLFFVFIKTEFYAKIRKKVEESKFFVISVAYTLAWSFALTCSGLHPLGLPYLRQERFSRLLV